MKPRYSIIILLAAALLSAGCGGKGSSGKETSSKSASSGSNEESKKEYLAGNVLTKMDSLVSEIGRLGKLPIISDMQNGKLSITEKEKMVKPDYLLPASEAGALNTLKQKYCGVMVYGVDMNIAELYDMPSVEAYRKVTGKLLVEIDNQALTGLVSGENEEQTGYKEIIREIYEEELEREQVNYFWDLMIASTVESLYITTRNIDKFILCFDDATAREVTKRISKFREAVEELIPYHPEMENLYMVLEPLYSLNASNVASLTSELYRLKNDISRIRETILRD